MALKQRLDLLGNTLVVIIKDIDQLTEAIKKNELNFPMEVCAIDLNIGKWSLSKLWRAWMSDIAKWMSANGATMPLVIGANGEFSGQRAFNADDAHELFSVMTLGTDKDGNRLSWSKSGRDGCRPASKGERVLAMQRVEAWATSRGIKLLNPNDSDYFKLKLESGD